MKKDRDCNNNIYPVYPMYMGPGMMNYGMGMNMPMDNFNGMNNYNMMDNNSFASQLNALEKRISNLEAMVSNSNYNNSTYQMM